MGKIFKDAAIIALTFGLVGLLCAECLGSGNSTGNGGGGGGGGGTAPQMDQTGGGFVPPPMPTYQPQMDWTPITDDAQDGVQG
jgi:hypothetical protein